MKYGIFLSDDFGSKIPYQSGQDFVRTMLYPETLSSQSFFLLCLSLWRGFPSGSDSKESACNAGDTGWSLGWEDPREKGIAIHSSISCQEHSIDRGAWGLQFMGLQRTGHDWATNTFSFYFQRPDTHHNLIVLPTFSDSLTFLSWTFTMQTSCVSNSYLTFTSWRIRTNARLPHSFSRADERRVCFIEDISRKIVKERKILENFLVESFFVD